MPGFYTIYSLSMENVALFGLNQSRPRSSFSSLSPIQNEVCHFTCPKFPDPSGQVDQEPGDIRVLQNRKGRSAIHLHFEHHRGGLIPVYRDSDIAGALRKGGLQPFFTPTAIVPACHNCWQKWTASQLLSFVGQLLHGRWMHS